MPRKQATAPKAPLEPQTFDETNVAQLGLISLHERVGADYTQWVKTLEIDGHSAELSCKSTEDVGGVPHGIDGDVANVLGILYLKQGAPENGYVQATAYQLLTLAGFPDNAGYYARLDKSLERLLTAKFRITRAWRRKRTSLKNSKEQPGFLYDSTQFAYITQINRVSLEKDALGVGTSLEIKLADPVAESLRQRHVYPVDLEFAASLSRSQARGLYRLLSAVRLRDTLSPLSAFSVGVLEWADTCKIRESYPTKVKRALQDAHQELLERGFLSEVRFEGRGDKARLSYTFADPPLTPGALPEGGDGDAVSQNAQNALSFAPQAESKLLESLSRYGLRGPAAHKMLVQYGPSHVGQRLAKFEKLLVGGYRPKSRSSVLVDVIRDHEGKYPDDPAPGPVTVQNESFVRAARNPGEEPNPLLGLPPSEAAARLVSTLKVLYRGKLGDAVLRALRERIESGEWSAVEVSARAAKAAASLGLEDFALDLERELALG